MLNQRSIETITSDPRGSEVVLPRYRDYCFSNIPGTICRLLSCRGGSVLPVDCFGESFPKVERVVSLFVDCLGWKFIDQFDHPLLRRFEREGCCSKLTAQFPSTTAAQVTTLATGLSVGQSAVYEWWFRHETTNDLVSPLTFQSRSGNELVDLESLAIQTSDVFPTASMSLSLKAQGVNSVAVLPSKLVASPANRYLTRGSRRLGFDSIARMVGYCKEVNRSTQQGWISIYLDDLDSVGHRQGPDSPAFVETRKTVLDALLPWVDELRDGRTAFLLFGDHGQVATSPQNPNSNCMLDRECPELLPLLERAPDGAPLPPAGGMRDVFLHVKPEFADECCELLANFFGPKALVLKTESAINEGWFGPQVSELFRKRVGNVLVLPCEFGTIRWSSHAKNRAHHLGDHGGLHRDEMEIGFLTLV